MVAVAVASCAIAFAAAAYGGVEPWSESLLVLAAGIGIAVSLAGAIRDGLSRSAVSVLVCCAVIGLLAWCQSTPLPSSWVEALSPARAGTVAELLDPAPEWLSLSYNPADTRQSLRLLLIGVAIFSVVATNVRQSRTACWLLLMLFTIGVVEALLAIAQQATDAPGIYWGSVSEGELRSGSFVNHSNFSQFLNLTIGASLALFLVRLSEERHDRSIPRSSSRDLRSVFRRHGWLVIGIAVQVLAVTVSLSRAGTLAMTAAGVVALLMMRRQHSAGRAVWLLAAVPPIGLLGLGWLGYSDRFLSRIETLQGEAPLSDRLALGLATLRVGADHWLTGAGLGAHASVFPAYDTTGAVAFAEQADNDYAQLFEEMGLPGCLLVALLLGTLFRATVRLLRRSGESIRYVAIGIVYGMVAIAIQSLSDFGMRVPAVFCAAAALAGIGVGLSEPTRPIPNRFTPRRVGFAVAAAMVLVGLWTGALVSSIAEYRAERWWSLAYDLDNRVRFADSEADPQNYLDMIAAAETAARLKPDRPKYAFWLNAYRWQAFEFARGQGIDPAADPNQQRATTTAIADALATTRRIGPTFGPAYTLEGQLRLVTGDATAGAALIRKGVRLSPNDPVACFAAASVELSSRAETASDSAAYALLSRAVGLDGTFFLDAAKVVVDERADVEFAIELADQDPSRLQQLSGWLSEAGGDNQQAIETIALRIDRATLSRIESGAAPPHEIAAFAKRRASLGQYEEAASYYRTALAQQFSNVGWRIALVDCLVALERFEEAEREAGVCLRQQPGSKAARTRIEAIQGRINPAADLF